MFSCVRQFVLLILLNFAFLLAGCNSASIESTPSPNMLITAEVATAVVTGPCFESGCHADLKTHDAPYKHQPYVDNRCLDCHTTFHTPDVQKMYTQSDIDLCYRCHPSGGLGNTHPVGEGIIDQHTNQMMTCTSTCHRSHTAPYPYLLTLSPDGELCVSCHQEFVK